MVRRRVAHKKHSTGSDLVQAGDAIDGFVHVVRLKRFFSLRTLADYDQAQFNVLHMMTVSGSVPPSEDFFRHGGRVVEAITYRPGADRFVDEDGFEALNLYRPSRVTATHGAVGRWLELLQHVIPEDPPREHVLNFFAHLAQRPGVKVNHAIVLGGGQGIGKDSVLKPIIDAIGPHNVGIVTPHELDSSFNDWVLNKSLLLVQELAAFHNRGLANRLKPLLAEPPHVLRINRKFLPAFDVPNLVNVIMMTNSTAPLAIEPDDRRFFFYHSAAPPKDAAYYGAYHQWAAAHASDVLGYLLARDIAAFDPKARPPMTAAKSTLIADSRPLLRQHLDAILDGLPDLITIKSVIDALPLSLRSVSPRALGHELRDLGARELRKVRLLNGERRRVWALRRADMYGAMSERALAANFAAMRPAVRVLPGAGLDLDLGQP
jgi:hypothetical protein